jgi:hypothetical protein
MSDPISITAIIVSSLTAIGGVIAGIHIKRMKSGCCESECFNPNNSKTNSPKLSSSPIEKEPNKQASSSIV